MTFNIPTQSLGEVFQNQYPFEIPKYQRGYAWEQEEITDLIKDIAALRTLPPAATHFMGGIVHVSKGVANTVSRLHEVVDGQQRMATFTLLIAAITHGIDELSATTEKKPEKKSCEAHKEELMDAYLFYKVTINGERIPTPKLVMSSVDKEFFENVVNNHSSQIGRKTHERIQQAYDRFKKDLVRPILADTSTTVKAKLKKLVELAKRTANSFVVIHIVSRSRGEAYRLFSVLNDRGRNLSDGDLLRAKTLEMTEKDNKAQGRIEQMWDRILDGSEEDIEKFLRAYYPSTQGKRAPKSGLYDAYENCYLSGKNIKEVETFVSQIEKEKRAFDHIREGLWPFNDSSSTANAWDKDRLFRLTSILRHEAAHPLLISAVHLGESKFIEILRLLERFVFRYINIVGAHPSPIYVAYYEEAVTIRTDPNYSVESLRKKLRKLLIDRAPNDQFVKSLTLKLRYSDDTAKNRLIKHFLTTIESYQASVARGEKGRKLAPSSMVVFDIIATTLEHIYPQNPKPADNIEEMNQNINLLGNITILASSDNNAAANDSFSKKRQAFRNSTVALNREISQLTKWGKTEYEEREKELLNLAQVVFDI